MMGVGALVRPVHGSPGDASSASWSTPALSKLSRVISSIRVLSIESLQLSMGMDAALGGSWSFQLFQSSFVIDF